MKKVLSLFFSICFLVVSCSSVTVSAKVGDVIGTAYHTDIVAYINHYAIPSYISNGQSCIVAEDLKNFGFNVVWNGNKRTLEITKGTSSKVKEMEVTKFEKTGVKYANTYETDIKVYANGKQITSYALNGYTMIPVEELTMFGKVAWIANERAIKLWVNGVDMRSTKQEAIKNKIGPPIGSSICVDGIGFNKNSADGIKVYWEGKNYTGKTINYYTTHYAMYNPVGDPAKCEIKKTNRVSVKTVGPVKPGETLIDYGLIAYSKLCHYIVLEKIFLEYSDGTTEWIEYGYKGGETLWDKYNNPRSGLSIYKGA